MGTTLALKTLGETDETIKKGFVASNEYLQPDRNNPDSTVYQRVKSTSLFIQSPQNKQFRKFAAVNGTPPIKYAMLS